jgi:hypothetical protein
MKTLSRHSWHYRWIKWNLGFDDSADSIDIFSYAIIFVLCPLYQITKIHIPRPKLNLQRRYIDGEDN